MLVSLLRIPTSKFSEDVDKDAVITDPSFLNFVGPSSLKLDLKKLVGSEEYSDVKFLVEGDLVPGHLCILIRSPVFCTMFTTGMRESEERVVAIEDASKEAFMNLLYYIYSGSLNEQPTFSGYIELMKVADRYLLEELKSDCSKVLAGKINPANCLSVLSVADACNVDELKGRALDMGAKNFSLLACQVAGIHFTFFFLSPK